MKNPREIAIVDDQKENLVQVRNSLSRFHANLKEFESYEDFFRFYVPWTPLPDLLILDYFLEKWKTGRELLLEMRRVFWDRCDAVSVIGFSSVEECSMELAEMSRGRYLKKVKWAAKNRDLERMVGEMLAEGVR